MIRKRRVLSLGILITAVACLILILVVRWGGGVSRSASPQSSRLSELQPIRHLGTQQGEVPSEARQDFLKLPELQARLDSLEAAIARAKYPDEWFSELAALHGEIISIRGERTTVAELTQRLTSDHRSVQARCVMAIILGTLTEHARNRLAQSLPRLSGDVGLVALYALGLNGMNSDVAEGSLKSFWLVAALHVGNYGLFTPFYEDVYRNRALGLPLDDSPPSLARVDLPGSGFLHYMGRNPSAEARDAVIAYVRNQPSYIALLLSWQILHLSDPKVSEFARDLLARSDGLDERSRWMLVQFIGDGDSAEADLTMVLSQELGAADRTHVIKKLYRHTDKVRLVPVIVEELSNSSIDDESACTLITLLGAIKSPSVPQYLEEIYTGASSDPRKLAVVSALMTNRGRALDISFRLDLLRRILEDSSPGVRKASVQALGTIKESEEVIRQILKHHLSSERDPSIIEAVKDVLGRIRR